MPTPKAASFTSRLHGGALRLTWAAQHGATKHKEITMGKTAWMALGAAAAAAITLAAPAAHARTNVDVQIGFGVPYYGYSQPSYVYTQPTYVYPQPTYAYPQPYYGGHRRFRDNDRDGVPNRYDRDRDGDGVPNRFDRRPRNPYRY